MATLGTTLPNGTVVCPGPMKATSEGVFQHQNPLEYSLPLLILQILLVLVFTRCLSYLLKPLRQPRVVAEIIGGIILGPSALGRSKAFLHNVFPAKSLTVLDTVANMGLLFFLFLVGLELDIRSLRKTGKKALGVALAGIILPFVLGIGTSIALLHTIADGDVARGPFFVFMGVALSITAFPVLARILAELKLLTADMGRIAMSATAVNDVAAWILLALAIALSGTETTSLVALWVLLSGIAFIAFAIFVIRPVLDLMARRSIEGEPVKELHICITLAIVLACGFITDAIGIHVLFGAFVAGIIVPKDGAFAGTLIDKVEDLVSVLFLPLYFVSSGLKTNVATIEGAVSWGMLVLVIFTACFGKIIGTLVVSMLFKVNFRESLALGFLMNTKGLVELIVLNIGKDRKVLNDQTFAVLVLMALVTTFITTPIVMALYKPARRGAPYKHRAIRRKDLDTELRILACFHSSYSIPSLINLIESSRGTRKRGKLSVYAMHLMELSERSSAIIMVHKARKNGLPFWNKMRNGQDQMVVAFDAYQKLSSVSVRPMTAISQLTDIHEDICTSAHQKRAALIIIPFHKKQKFDGTMESLEHSIHEVNKKVLSYAPCSVGILVDRGLGGTSQVTASEVSYTIAVPFFGGRDDAEALAYGMRMAEHPGIMLTVVKFVPPPGETLLKRSLSIVADDGVNSKEQDEEILSEFMGASKKLDSITYEERVVQTRVDIIAGLRAMGKSNLFLVGRFSPVDPLVDNSDCQELGPIGCFLATSDFSTTASILVIQQYHPNTKLRPLILEEEGLEEEVVRSEPDTPRIATASSA